MPIHVSMVTIHRGEGGRERVVSALALPAFTGKKCGQLLPHRVLRASYAPLPRGGKELYRLSAQVGQLRGSGM